MDILNAASNVKHVCSGRHREDLPVAFSTLNESLSGATGSLKSLLKPIAEAIQNHLAVKGSISRDEALFVAHAVSLLADENIVPSKRLDGLLDSVMTFRQELISTSALSTVLNVIEQELPSLSDDLRLKFLSACNTYDMQHQAKNRGESPDWSKPLAQLEGAMDGLTTKSPASWKFFLVNQAYLAARNAASAASGDERKSFEVKRDGYLQGAEAVLPQLEEEKAHEAIGYIRYNLARQLLDAGEKENGWSNYVEAANARMAHFAYLQENGIATDSYATQVIKMGFDAGFLFPDRDLSSFPADVQYEKNILSSHQINMGFSVRPRETREAAWRERYGDLQ